MGVCVRVWDWSETSQTVSVFLREHGLVRAVAKGAKRDNAKFSGGLEILTLGEAILSLKLGQLSLLTSWDLRETVPAARKSLSSFHSGMLLLDLTTHCLREQDPHPALFDVLLSAMRALGEMSRDRAVVLAYLWAVLDETGHRPELEQDAATGRPLESAPTYAFRSALGGLVRDDPAMPGPAWRVRAETVSLLRQVARGGMREFGKWAGSADAAAIGRGTRLLAMHFREVFGVEPPTVAKLLAEGDVQSRPS